MSTRKLTPEEYAVIRPIILNGFSTMADFELALEAMHNAAMRDAGKSVAVNTATPAPNHGRIRIESDGTPQGTKAFYPDGSQIAGVRSYEPINQITKEFASIWRLECELIGKETCLQVEAGPGVNDSKILAPDGTELMARSAKVYAYVGEIPILTVEFYVERGGNPKSEPKLGCATTAELLNELQARAELGGYSSYRTIDAD